MSNAFSVLINYSILILYDKMFIYKLCTFNICIKTNIYLLRILLEYYEKSFKCKLFFPVGGWYNYSVSIKRNHLFLS